MKRPLYYLFCAIACTSMVSATMPMAAIADAIQPQATPAQQTQTDTATSDTDKAEGTTSPNATGSSDPTSDTEDNSGTPAGATSATDTATPAAPTPQPSLRAQATGTPEAISTTSQTGYAHSATATQNGVTFTVSWNDAPAGTATTFHVTQTNGSSQAKARMDVPTYWDGGSQESVCDPSRPAWASYYILGTSGHDFTFDFTASGTYRIHFYFMDNDRNDPQNDKGIYYLRTTAEVTVNDPARPSVTQIANNAVDLCRQETNGSEYDMALWLHDWTLDQLEYDHNLNWCSAESGLTRHQGTCESYQRIYSKLLNAAGIANGRITGNGHTWNAVKIDGKWCQMDLTWDDTSDNWYGDLDQRHLYFGLTDELMAIAHSDHTANYQKDGYAYRSTDLSNNYFVRKGKADEWAEKYADRIQQHLDAKEESFSIDADNQSFPPSISGIQNGIVAYAMNQCEWKTNDTTVILNASSDVTIKSYNEWSAKYDFSAEYPKTPDSPSTFTPIHDGLDYSGVFDAQYYLDRYPDVATVYGTNPARAFEHFVCYGMTEGRRGSESFDALAYRSSHPELEIALGNALPAWYAHYVRGGFSPYFRDNLDYSGVFDAQFYLTNNPDVAAVFGTNPAHAFEHFVYYGMVEGRRGSMAFDVFAYRSSHPTLQRSLGSSLPAWYAYYVRGGLSPYVLDGLDYSGVFNAQYYLEKYPDVAAVYGTEPTRAFEHFVCYGMVEGRRGSESFDVLAWRSAHPELEAEFGDNLAAWYKVYAGGNE